MGFMTCILIFSLIIPVASWAGTKTATVTYRNIKVYIDSVETTLKDLEGNAIEPVILFDTVYVPLSPLARAFGKSSTWDGNANAIYIGPKPGTVTHMTDICPAYQSSGNYNEYSAIKSGNTEKFSMGGVTYTNGLIFSNNSWAVYNLNGKYKNFSGVLCHVDGTYNYPVTLKIFFDGVLKEEIELAPDMAPIQVNFDVTGVIQIKIQHIQADYNAYKATYGIANPILK